MRLLSIFGNTIRKRLISAVSFCCSLFWEDPVIFSDNCRWKEPSCCSYLWENETLWNQNCPVRISQEECCSSNYFDDSKVWDDACEWPDGYGGGGENHIIWDESEDWDEISYWTTANVWSESETWIDSETWLS
jgi:hypothetical protein